MEYFAISITTLFRRTEDITFLLARVNGSERQKSITLDGMCFKVTPDLRGCPQGKNSCARHFKGKHGKLYIIGKLNKYRFRKKNILPVSSIPQKKIANNHENDNVSFN